jgi:hypothetical protein
VESLINTYAPLVYVGIGAIFGIAYLTDAWRPIADPKDIGLRKSPKVRGLLYILGGAILPIVPKLFSLITKSGEKDLGLIYLHCYFAGFVITVLFVLLVSTVPASFIGYQKSKTLDPTLGVFGTIAEAFVLTTIALKDGSTKFIEALENREIVVVRRKHTSELEALRRQFEEVESQTDKFFEHFGGYFAALAENVSNDRKGIDHFVVFCKSYIDELSKELLTPKEDYRIAIYYLDDEQRKFFYLVGCSKTKNPHTKRPFYAEKSLAGQAVNDPNFPLIYVDGDIPTSEANPDFLKFEQNHWYKSSVACYIYPIRSSRDDLPVLVLCIDCYGDLYKMKKVGFLRQLSTYQSLAFADAILTMNVRSDDTKTWLQGKPWYRFEARCPIELQPNNSLESTPT